VPNLKEHLKISRKFLGFDGNPVIHRLLDGAGLPSKLRPQYHKITHTPQFVGQTIKSSFGEEGELEAWGHLLADWGFITIYKNPRKKTIPARKIRRKG